MTPHASVFHGTSIPAVAATSTSPVWPKTLKSGPPQSGPLGRVGLWWRLSPDSSLERIDVAPELAGLGAGPSRDDGWQFVQPGSPVVLERGGEPVLMAHGDVPAGRYAQAFVAMRSATAVGVQGEDLIRHVEPISFPVMVRPDDDVDVEIELIALPRSERSGGGHQLFVKNARILGGRNG